MEDKSYLDMFSTLLNNIGDWPYKENINSGCIAHHFLRGGSRSHREAFPYNSQWSKVTAIFSLYHPLFLIAIWTIFRWRGFLRTPETLLNLPLLSACHNKKPVHHFSHACMGFKLISIYIQRVQYLTLSREAHQEFYVNTMC